MNFQILSVSSIAMLLTTIELPLSRLSLSHPTATQPTAMQSTAIQSTATQSATTRLTEASNIAQTIRITDSETEVIGGNGASIRIINRQGPRHIHQQQRSVNTRSERVNANRTSADRVNEAHTLTVSTTGRSLDAELKVDGRMVKTLANRSETVNMSPYLSAAGEHTIEIVGTYSPATATAQISLTGPGTQMSRQVSGLGVLDQTFQLSTQ